ncbi:hypothetical protein [Streptomyces erythrochromogenes]
MSTGPVVFRVVQGQALDVMDLLQCLAHGPVDVLRRHPVRVTAH